MEHLVSFHLNRNKSLEVFNSTFHMLPFCLMDTNSSLIQNLVILEKMTLRLAFNFFWKRGFLNP